MPGDSMDVTTFVDGVLAVHVVEQDLIIIVDIVSQETLCFCDSFAHIFHTVVVVVQNGHRVSDYLYCSPSYAQAQPTLACSLLRAAHTMVSKTKRILTNSMTKPSRT